MPGTAMCGTAIRNSPFCCAVSPWDNSLFIPIGRECCLQGSLHLGKGAAANKPTGRVLSPIASRRQHSSKPLSKDFCYHGQTNMGITTTYWVHHLPSLLLGGERRIHNIRSHCSNINAAGNESRCPQHRGATAVLVANTDPTRSRTIT